MTIGFMGWWGVSAREGGMPKSPFEILGREVVDGGVVLVFRCTACGRESRLTLLDDDPLDGRYPVACACGARVNMHFGSPLLGRALLRSIRRSPETPDDYHRCPAPLMN